MSSAPARSASPAPTFHVVLHQPEIPPNTGNIGRTCLAVGAKLWLVRPLGFRLDEKHLKRAGMDYWPLLNWEAVDDWADYRTRQPEGAVWTFTKYASRPVWEADFAPGDTLLFGSESSGLPETLMTRDPSRNLVLPMRSEVRSLNLASTVTAGVYEAVRQTGGLPVPSEPLR